MGRDGEIGAVDKLSYHGSHNFVYWDENYGWARSRGVSLFAVPIGMVGECAVAAASLPDPTKPYAEFMYGLLLHSKVTHLGDYEKAAGKDRRLWVQDMAQHMSEALTDEIVKVAITMKNNEKVHGYEPQPEAIAFWKNGVEAGRSAEEILSGWKAMMSLVKPPSQGASA